MAKIFALVAFGSFVVTIACLIWVNSDAWERMKSEKQSLERDYFTMHSYRDTIMTFKTFENIYKVDPKKWFLYSDKIVYYLPNKPCGINVALSWKDFRKYRRFLADIKQREKRAEEQKRQDTEDAVLMQILNQSIKDIDEIYAKAAQASSDTQALLDKIKKSKETKR